MKRRIRSSRQLKVHRWFCLLRGFQHFESQTMTCLCSLRLLYKVHAIELDLQSQLHQVFLFSHYSLTEVSKERNAAASVSRFSSVKMSSILSRSTKQYSECFGEPDKPSSSSQSRRLFVSNLLHSFYCFYGHCHFVFSRKFQGRR